MVDMTAGVPVAAGYGLGAYDDVKLNLTEKEDKRQANELLKSYINTEDFNDKVKARANEIVQANTAEGRDISLEDATIGCLDRTDMDRADCKLNLKESKANPGNAVFYLRQLNVIQTIVPDFGGAYEDWDEPIEANPEVLAENEEFLK